MTNMAYHGTRYSMVYVTCYDLIIWHIRNEISSVPPCFLFIYVLVVVVRRNQLMCYLVSWLVVQVVLVPLGCTWW